MSDVETLLEDYVDVPAYHMSFKFKFVKQSSGEVYVYILQQPSYRADQPQSGHATHRYGVGDRPYICYDPQPRDLATAKTIAQEWAIRTAYYIRHGKWFNKGEAP